MTREEAIEAIKEAYGNSEYTDEIIKALEQEKEYIKNDDCISRQEFLKRIRPYNTSDPHDRALYNFAFNKMMQCASVKAESEE